MIFDVHDTFSWCASASHAPSTAAAPAASLLDAPIVAAYHMRVFLWDCRSWPAGAHRSLPRLVRRRTRALVMRGMRKRV